MALLPASYRSAQACPESQCPPRQGSYSARRKATAEHGEGHPEAILAFLDEDEPFARASDPGRPRRLGPDRQRQIMVRRGVAVAGGLLILILLLLGIRGCLNARKERGFENYASDLSAITSQAKQLSDNFFGRLEDPGNLSELNFEAEVSANRGTAENLLDRARGLDTPDELNGAQSELVKAFELRRDGLAGIADQISTALGTQGRRDATEAIANYMRYFLASDVLYGRAQVEIDRVLTEEEIAAKAPASVFLPEPVEQWIDPVEVGTILGSVVGGGAATPGVHGVALIQTVVNPGGTVLTPDATNTVSADGPVTLAVDAQNQGDSEETEVLVSFSLTGGTETIEGEGTVPRIAAGETKTVEIPIDPDPPAGETLTLEVTVQPVPGEEIEDNNTATYEVTFG